IACSCRSAPEHGLAWRTPPAHIGSRRRARRLGQLLGRLVLPPKSAHVREESFPARSSRVGRGAGPRASFLARPPRDPGHGEAVTQIPGYARELARAIGGARGEAGEGTMAPRGGCG